MSKELKNLSVAELQAKMVANKEAITAFESAKLTESPYYKAAVEERDAITAELDGRKGEMLAASCSDAISKTIQKELQGKESEIEKDTVLTTVISKNPETGEIVVKTTSGRPRKAASEGGVSASTGARGERKGAKVTLLDGTVIEEPTAAKAVNKLKELGVIPHNIGEGDSQVRVLDSLVTKGQIKSYEKVELVKETPAEASIEVNAEKTQDTTVSSAEVHNAPGNPAGESEKPNGKKK